MNGLFRSKEMVNTRSFEYELKGIIREFCFVEKYNWEHADEQKVQYYREMISRLKTEIQNIRNNYLLDIETKIKKKGLKNGKEKTFNCITTK